MISIAWHSIAFGRVLTLIFTLISLHFAGILHMCVREEGENYCATSSVQGHDSCPKKALPVVGMSICKGDDSRSSVVVGRLRVVLAFVEKDSKVQNVEVLPLLTSPFVSPALGNTSSWFSYSFLESVSPPSVEKFVLNETFLI